jgi:cytosine/adenosine deaminase-related metal-dependent hydrolase
MGRSYRDLMLVKDSNERKLIRAGGTILLATDGGMYGATARASRSMGQLLALPDMPWELGSAHIPWFRAALERGMTPTDGLLAATRNIAEAYGKGDELGTIERGKLADLLVLEADPLADPANLARIAIVVKDGALVDRDRLPERPVLTAAAQASLRQ